MTFSFSVHNLVNLIESLLSRTMSDLRKSTELHVYVCIHVYMYVCMYVCMYACI